MNIIFAFAPSCVVKKEKRSEERGERERERERERREEKEEIIEGLGIFLEKSLCSSVLACVCLLVWVCLWCLCVTVWGCLSACVSLSVCVTLFVCCVSCFESVSPSLSLVFLCHPLSSRIVILSCAWPCVSLYICICVRFSVCVCVHVVLSITFCGSVFLSLSVSVYQWVLRVGEGSFYEFAISEWFPRCLYFLGWKMPLRWMQMLPWHVVDMLLVCVCMWVCVCVCVCVYVLCVCM